MLPDISRQLLNAFAEGTRPESIHVGIGTDGAFVYNAESQKAATTS
jgi:hypothetical protein